MSFVKLRHPVTVAVALVLTLVITLSLTLGYLACQKGSCTRRRQVVAISPDAEANLGAEAFAEETVILFADLHAASGLSDTELVGLLWLGVMVGLVPPFSQANVLASAYLSSAEGSKSESAASTARNVTSEPRGEGQQAGA